MTSLNQRLLSLENNAGTTTGTTTGTITIADVENLQATLETKQNSLTAGTNISIVDNVISSSGSGGSGTTIDTTTDIVCNSVQTTSIEVLNAPVLITDHAVKIKSQVILKGQTFDTILLRRISGDNTINLREVQLWINNSNVFITNVNLPSENRNGQPIGNSIAFVSPDANGVFVTKAPLQTYFASNAVNNDIGDNFDTHSVSQDNASLYIPLNSPFNIADIQSFVLYNRTFSTTGARSIGLQLQIYNRFEDPSLSNPLALSNTIPEDKPVYRFDFPASINYTDFVDVDSTQFITENAEGSNRVLISTDITFAEGSEPDIAVALKIEDGRLETNQEISAKNVVVANTTPTLDTELTSKLYVDTLIANLQAQINAMP